jgi:hypothetical protein
MLSIGSKPVSTSKKTKKRKPQKAWLRQSSLHHPHENNASAPEPVIIGPYLPVRRLKGDEVAK